VRAYTHTHTDMHKDIKIHNSYTHTHIHKRTVASVQRPSLLSLSLHICPASYPIRRWCPPHHVLYDALPSFEVTSKQRQL
jgi:hypothetical protein